MAIELIDKVCLITGGGAGVGRGLVHGFLRRGASVAAGVRDHAKAKERAMPESVRTVAMDVTCPEQVDKAVRQVVDQFGRIDVLVNNAGIYPRCAADEMAHEEWRQVLDTNLDGAWRCSHTVLPHFKNQGGGVIINIGSIALRLGMANLSHYHASKGGLVGMTRGMARDLGSYDIRVNCVHLGAVLTEGELGLFPDQAAVLKTVEAAQALAGRMTPETVEPVFAFLASDESRDITGQCLTVDRGWSHD